MILTNQYCSVLHDTDHHFDVAFRLSRFGRKWQMMFSRQVVDNQSQYIFCSALVVNGSVYAALSMVRDQIKYTDQIDTKKRKFI